MRRISQIRSDISRSVARFLKTKNPAMRRLRHDVMGPLESIGEVAIVGGLVRDIVRYGLDQRPISDIDLVVQGSPSAVAAVAHRLSAVPNRFGGFGVVAEGYKVDFWALSTTWARTRAGVKIANITDLLDSTFFNWDAILYSTKTESIYFKDRYLEDIRGRFLEINLGETASHKGNLIRALRRLLAWQAEPGPRLRNFLNEGFAVYSWDDILAQEKSAFYNHYLAQFTDSRHYLDHLRGGEVGGPRPLQLSLFQSSELPSRPGSQDTSWSTRLPEDIQSPQRMLAF